MYPFNQIGGYANVQSAVSLVCKDVYIACFHVTIVACERNGRVSRCALSKDRSLSFALDCRDKPDNDGQ
jgi:hypothetical protein